MYPASPQANHTTERAALCPKHLRLGLRLRREIATRIKASKQHYFFGCHLSGYVSRFVRCLAVSNCNQPNIASILRQNTCWLYRQFLQSIKVIERTSLFTVSEAIERKSPVNFDTNCSSFCSICGHFQKAKYEHKQTNWRNPKNCPSFPFPFFLYLTKYYLVLTSDLLEQSIRFGSKTLIL